MGPATECALIFGSGLLGQAAPLFVHPGLAALGAAAVALPIIIHLLARARRHPQPWGAMRFLIEAMRRQRTRLRLRQWLLLIMRCLAVLLLGLALARPLTRGILGHLGMLEQGIHAGRRVALLVDDSYSASAAAADGGPTRFERSRKAATALLESLEPAARVLLWPIGRTHQDNAPLDIEARTLSPRDAITRLTDMEPTFGPADPRRTWETALRRAGDWLTRPQDDGPRGPAEDRPLLVIASHQPPALREALESFRWSADPASAANSTALTPPGVLITRPAAAAVNVQIENVQVDTAGTTDTGDGSWRAFASSTMNAGLPVRVTVQRRGRREGTWPPTDVTVQVSLAPLEVSAGRVPVGDSEDLGDRSRTATVHFREGAEQATARILLPHTWRQAINHGAPNHGAPSHGAPFEPGDTQPRVLTARLLDMRENVRENALNADDVRHHWVHWHDGLRVVLVSDGADTAIATATATAYGADDIDGTPQVGLTPTAWWRAALCPEAWTASGSASVSAGANDRGAVALIEWTPQALDRLAGAARGGEGGASGSASGLNDGDAGIRADAVVLLRPDLLDASGAAALAMWTRAGGVLWITPPAVSGEPRPLLDAGSVAAEDADDVDGTDAAPWMSAVFAALGLHGALREVSDAPEAAGWTLASTPPPPDLSLLAAEWDALLAPVRVHRALTWHETGPATGSAAEPAADTSRNDGGAKLSMATHPGRPWLTLRHGQPWLLHWPVGDGHVLLMLSAVRTDWTNLPTRPLFVPLVHEALHTLAARRPLDSRWRTAWAGEPETPWDRTPPAVTRSAGIQPTGIQLAQPDHPAAGATLVNIAPAAGDTSVASAQALSAALDAVTGRAGGGNDAPIGNAFDNPFNTSDAPRPTTADWAWLDADDADSTRTRLARLDRLARGTQGDPGADLGRPLLVIAAILLLLEGLVARMMSHAPVRAAGGAP